MTATERYVETVRAALAEAGFVDLADRVYGDNDEDFDDDDCIPAMHGAEGDAEHAALQKACDVAHAASARQGNERARI
jgi:ABC-type nickel/cobalt efflux system permease component RcnA